ncbi:MAG TPA: hypoxanthine phosphoribosyltransferase [Thermoanaerobaculia bacterium]|nr:hypoxanthine phosphoribosyltransferase [Thermoanaerobaculia bacterium]
MHPNAEPTAPEVFISPERLQRRIAELAAEIDRDYYDSRRLVCIGVLKGAVFFMSDLLKQLQVPLAVDFFQVSSYRGSTTPGELRVRKDIDLPVRGEDVLLIEDIIDTGYTLRTILDMFRFRGASTVRLCALLDKRQRREVEVTVDYRGFEIDDRFVVGYGLDYDERWRNLPYIGYLPAAESSDAPGPPNRP